MTQKGFTLIEAMIVVAIIGILAAIAVPSYQRYIIETHRGDMKAEMMRISQDLQRYKVINKDFRNVTLNTAGATSQYPAGSNPWYTLSLTNPDNKSWQLTATPIATSTQKGDGVICLNSKGEKSWSKGATACNFSASW